MSTLEHGNNPLKFKCLISSLILNAYMQLSHSLYKDFKVDHSFIQHLLNAGERRQTQWNLPDLTLKFDSATFLLCSCTSLSLVLPFKMEINS